MTQEDHSGRRVVGPIARDRAGILAALQAFVAERADAQMTPDQVDPAAALLEESILDSVGGLELLVLIEETWGVPIAESELVGHLHCLDHIVDHILAHETPS